MNSEPSNLSALIGCAGWSVPSDYAEHFSAQGSHLERYATRFNAVEINSSFYRSHRPQTYAKWAAAVPENFRFAVKVPKIITHQQRLENSGESLQQLLDEVGELGPKLGPLLVQLPPSLAFEEKVARNFFSDVRARFQEAVVCEPRHPSWFAPNPNDLLNEFQVAQVATDPTSIPGAAEPRGWGGLVYYRLHGSPTIYRSSYTTEFINHLATNLRKSLDQAAPTWCIFDNTAEGAATGNALKVIEWLGSSNRRGAK